MSLRNLALSLGLLACVTHSAAGVVATTGQIVEAPRDNRIDSAQLYLVDARNTLADRLLPQGFSSGPLSPAFLPIGTAIFEYQINYAPAGSVGSASGTVTFSTEILGLDLLAVPEALEAADLPLYPNVTDTVAISPDRRTIAFSLNVNGDSDRFSFFVAQRVPEPGSVRLVALALLALVGMRCIGLAKSRTYGNAGR